MYPAGTSYPDYPETQVLLLSILSTTLCLEAIAGTHIIAPEDFDITGNTQLIFTLALSNKLYLISQYTDLCHLRKEQLLVDSSATSWTQYAVVPQGAFLALIATSITEAMVPVRNKPMDCWRRMVITSSVQSHGILR